MAYLDFDLTMPIAPADAAPLARFDRTSLMLSIAILVAFVGSIYALAFAALRQPFVAGVVTVVMLLPAASLIGGDRRRR